MALTEKAEEILEALWTELVENKKKSCDATLLRQDIALKELVRHGDLNVEVNKVTLTERGLEEARDCVRRHRLAERLLVDVLDLKKNQIHEAGCAFEHLLHKGLDESVCTLLGHPRFCPHGKPIPTGRCCRDSRYATGKAVLPLAELEVNQKAQVAYLHTHEREILEKLMALGALPGTDIVLLQRFPSFVFQMGRSQFAIDETLASHIYVRTWPQVKK